MCVNYLRLFLFITVLFSATAEAAIVAIDSVTTNGSAVVTSITDTYGTYTELIEPAIITNYFLDSNPVNTNDDFIALQPLPPPANFGEAVEGFVITKGTLNDAFKVNFGYELSDTARFFIMNNSSGGFNESPSVYSIGTNLSQLGIPVTIYFNNALTNPPVLLFGTWNRTGGTTLSNRGVYGATFTLEEIGLGGRGATGLDFNMTGNCLDLQMIGIAQQASSGSITGSVEVLSGYPTYNLTELGNLDWAYWFTEDNPATGVASNEMAGADLIGIAQAIGTGGSVRGSSSPTRPNVYFTATNGSHPVIDDVTDPRLTGVFCSQIDYLDKGISLPITLPEAGVKYKVTIFGAAYNAKAVLTAGFPGEMAKYVDYTLEGQSIVKRVGVYTLTVIPAKDNETLDVRIRMYDDDGDNAHVLLVAAAISLAPPAGTVILVY